MKVRVLILCVCVVFCVAFALVASVAFARVALSMLPCLGNYIRISL